jgi:hypothetical protein
MKKMREVPPPSTLRFAGSSAIDATRIGRRVGGVPLAICPRTPKNAPTPPVTACGAYPLSMIAPTNLPSGSRNSHLQSASVPWVTSAIAKPGAGDGLKFMSICLLVHVPFAELPLTATMSPMNSTSGKRPW